MFASESSKRICYRYVVCPHCGNEILAKSIDEEQKCMFCKRKYKIAYSGHGKKTYWEPIAIDYSYDKEGRPWVGLRVHTKEKL